MCRNPGPSGESLLVIAALVSLQMAQGRTADQLNLLAAFFEVLGDNLGLIAAARPPDGEGGACPGGQGLPQNSNI